MQFLRISMRKKVEQQVVAKIGCFRRSADERETGQIVSVITEAFNYGVPLLFFPPEAASSFQILSMIFIGGNHRVIKFRWHNDENIIEPVRVEGRHSGRHDGRWINI
jgi:hypothetical protein